MHQCEGGHACIHASKVFKLRMYYNKKCFKIMCIDFVNLDSL